MWVNVAEKQADIMISSQTHRMHFFKSSTSCEHTWDEKMTDCAFKQLFIKTVSDPQRTKTEAV